VEKLGLSETGEKGGSVGKYL